MEFEINETFSGKFVEVEIKQDSVKIDLGTFNVAEALDLAEILMSAAHELQDYAGKHIKQPGQQQ